MRFVTSWESTSAIAASVTTNSIGPRESVRVRSVNYLTASTVANLAMKKSVNCAKKASYSVQIDQNVYQTLPAK